MAEDTGRQDSDGQTSTPHRSRREARTFETSESYTDTLGDVFGDEVFDDDVFDDDAFAVEISRLSQFDQPVRGTHTYTSQWSCDTPVHPATLLSTQRARTAAVRVRTVAYGRPFQRL